MPEGGPIYFWELDRRAEEGRELFQSTVTVPFLHPEAPLPYHALTEGVISLYHFNTTSICSIIHNSEKKLDLEERKSVLTQLMIRSAKPHRSTSK